MRKILDVLLVIIIILSLTACSDSDLTADKQVYLMIEQNRPYGAVISPGAGYFVYDKGTIAQVELDLIEGYNFIDWQGPNGVELVNTAENIWKIQMDGDKEIKAVLKLAGFALLTTEPINGESNIPYDLAEIAFSFNNQLGITADYPQLKLFKLSSPENNLIDQQDIQIQENKIIINLANNYGRNSYLEFGAEYELNIENRILDIAGRSFRVPPLNFKVETVAPEAPFIGIDKVANRLEIFWQRSKDNFKGLGEDYVLEYRIYRSKNNKEFATTAYEILTTTAGDFQLDEVEIVFSENLEEDLDLSNTIYYYKIRAVNEDGKMSKFSNLVNTEGI